jgi:hypothetical protein
VKLAEEGLLSMGPDTLEAYFDAQRVAGYPAVHHSDGFVTRYRPAYRVVSGALLVGVLPDPDP